MTDLIRRLEEASEEDGELNVAMWRIIAPLEAASMQRSLEKMVYSGNDLEGLMANNCPNYTGDLQDAVSAVPENKADRLVFWRVGNDGEGANPADFKAEILLAGKFTSPAFQAVAATAPLAMCAAILRAMEANNE